MIRYKNGSICNSDANFVINFMPNTGEFISSNPHIWTEYHKFCKKNSKNDIYNQVNYVPIDVWALVITNGDIIKYDEKWRYAANITVDWGNSSFIVVSQVVKVLQMASKHNGSVAIAKDNKLYDDIKSLLNNSDFDNVVIEVWNENNS